jgi:membrane fusion protein (multidrug efflux system)
MRKAIFTALIACALGFPAMAQQQPAAVQVGVVKAERKPVARAGDYVGRVEAISRVEVRARITGYLEEVLFKEGDLIKEGSPLYRIEKGLFQAQVEQAEGALQRSKAAKLLSGLQLARAEELLEKQAGTAVARDQARAQDQQAHGAVMADEAILATAKINLSYTESSRRSREGSVVPASPRATWLGRAPER